MLVCELQFKDMIMLIDELIAFFMRPEIQEDLAFTALTITQDRDVARELLHDVYCLLYLKADKIDNVESPLAFLRKCVRNVAKNWVKKEARKIPLDSLSIDNLPNHHRLDKEITLFELRDWVNTELPEYAQERREAFLQHYIDEYPIEELAERYNVSPNALSQQFLRMRTKLKKRNPTYFMILMLFSKLH
jgi:RNA polymerase sigma-70 factor (ECF subfamily)